MASYGQAVPAAAHRPAVYGSHAAMPTTAAPAGTFSPGTKIQVGNHRVVIQKYLSEGGFAHVYLVKLPSPVDGTDQAVLKRVAVPDKESLRGMRTEVDTMKRLKGHKPIVTYIDSHASELVGGGYEVFLLMEYCNGGGLIDFMNTRLQHRLTEPEILKIFTDVAEGVACMHYLRPPLLHRDLKVENVLITVTSAGRKFKLCDFGSAAPPKPAPTTAIECRLMDEDVQKHTTMQYRSPEMIDVYRKLPIDEKSDIWALGVLLYKLCYYTTPFEEQGQLAILNATYKFPSYPVFSDRLKKLIASMLMEDQRARPNIFQVLRESCAMQGRDVPIKDIYSGRAHSEQRTSDKSAVADQNLKSTPVVGAVFSPQSTSQQQAIPEVERMRRGRPPALSTQPPVQAVQGSRPNPSPSRVTNGDPFAALDSKVSTVGQDELSTRFPTLDEFSILHDQGTKFEFDTASPTGTQPSKDLSQRVTEKLADQVFQATAAPAPVPAPNPASAPASVLAPVSASQRQSLDTARTNPYSTSAQESKVMSPPLKPTSAPSKPTEMSRASAIISSTPELQALSSHVSQATEPLYQPAPTRPSMVSTGTMTSTPPPERSSSAQYQIYRFPASDQNRASSVPRQSDSSSISRTQTPSLSRPEAPAMGRVSSYQGQNSVTRHPSSSRPSLEGGRPGLDSLDPLARARPQVPSAKPRPVSTHLESNLDYLREKEVNPTFNKPQGHPSASPRYLEKDLPLPPEPDDGMTIASNVDFLRSMEDSDPKKKDKAMKHSKRASLTSIGAGTKSIFAGKFGDAFKRFEGNSSSAPAPRTPSPLKDLERRDLTPIAGSEATDGRSDDGRIEEPEETPEMRRDREQRMLADEEARVAAAQAEYRRRVAQRDPASGQTPFPKSIGGVSRAVSIQNKVQILLEESNRSSSNVPRTAEGYGHYADATGTSPSRGLPSNSDGRPLVPRKPVGASATGTTPRSSIDNVRRVSTLGPGPSDGMQNSRAIPTGGSMKPMAPPKKPAYLNNVAAGGRAGSPPKPSIPSSSINVPKMRGVPPPVSREALVAADMAGQPMLDMTQAEKDDYVREFQKRFPSLTSIEMVERDLAAEAEARPGK